MDAAMNRTYLKYRDWTDFPDWFDRAQFDSMPDEKLRAAIERYTTAELTRRGKAEEKRLHGREGSHRLSAILVSGEPEYVPFWCIFGHADSAKVATSVIAAIQHKLDPPATFMCAPKSKLKDAEWLVFERELQELDEQIRDRPIERGSAGVPPRQRTLMLRELLRVESLAFNELAIGAVPGDGGGKKSNPRRTDSGQLDEVRGRVPQRIPPTGYIYAAAVEREYEVPRATLQGWTSEWKPPEKMDCVHSNQKLFQLKALDRLLRQKGRVK